jgi:hypothetical protein
MLSFIYFSLVIFNIISNTKQQNHSLKNSCFNFEETISGQINHCNVLINRFATPMCIMCNIKYLDIALSIECSRNVTCLILYFDDNTIFERYFIKYRDIFPLRFPPQTANLPSPALSINVNYYNITKITNEYINSLINIDIPNLVITIMFAEHPQGVAPLAVEGDFPSLLFISLTILVYCDYEHYYTMYKINEYNNGKPTITNPCQHNPSTVQVSTLN